MELFVSCVRYGGSQRPDGTRSCSHPNVRAPDGVRPSDCATCLGQDKYAKRTVTAKPRMSFSALAAQNAKVRRCKERKAQGLPCEEFPAVSKQLTWAYGITTVAKRERLLRRSLESLASAGFPQPHVFADGYRYEGPQPSTSRVPPLRTFGNWITGLAELYIRNPMADRFAMFQDDIVCCRRLREYLERWYPPDGYINLILYPENARGQTGWFKAPFKGQGAQGLVFDRKAVSVLLASDYIHVRPRVAGPRAWKYLDGGINGAMGAAHYWEYVHSPSLIGHTGETSTIGNQRQPGIPHKESYDPCSETR